MTIVEMAVGIALTAILGGSLISMGILAVRASNLARMKAKALRYAEEGIEVARRTRDQMSPSSIESLLDACPEGTNCCVVGGVLSSVGCGAAEELEGGIFSRTISVEEIEDRKARVTVEVTWESGQKSVGLETFLTAWAS